MGFPEVPDWIVGNTEGYQWSYTIIEFAVNTFGTQKLHAWIKNNGDFNSVFEISKEKFWTRWVDYLKAAYNEKLNNAEIKEIRVVEAYWSNDEDYNWIMNKDMILELL